MPQSLTPLVGIVILNYHQPDITLACVRSLIAREPRTTRVLWVENEAKRAWDKTRQALIDAGLPWQEVSPKAPLTEPGCVAVLRSEENLGYAGGNNQGLRLLDQWGIPFAWILNNDTELLAGNSTDLVTAALSRPNVGAWGTSILEAGRPPFAGGRLRPRDFASEPMTPSHLKGDGWTYVSGCSLFFRLETGRRVNFLPEDYFLYYEDAAFSLELHRRGYDLAAVPEVQVTHHGSLSSGDRSRRVEYYTCRNRWILLSRYFPEALPAQRRRRWHTLQKLFFRGRFDRLRLDQLAYRDFRAGRTGQWLAEV